MLKSNAHMQDDYGSVGRTGYLQTTGSVVDPASLGLVKVSLDPQVVVP